MARQPWFRFFPGDWSSDYELGLCSFCARGVLIELVGIMHLSPERGRLVNPDGTALSTDELSNMIRGDKYDFGSGLKELIDKGVLSRDKAGVVYSRRMVREAEISTCRSDAAKNRWSSERVLHDDLHMQKPMQNVDMDMVFASDSSKEGVQGENAGGIGITLARRIFAAYPKRAKAEAAVRAIARAAGAVRARGHPDPGGFLLERVKAFAASPLGQSGAAGSDFCPNCDSWMDAGRYDDDERTWQLRKPNETDERRRRDRNGENLKL